jgi:hypothetical protein
MNTCRGNLHLNFLFHNPHGQCFTQKRNYYYCEKQGVAFQVIANLREVGFQQKGA